MNVKQMDRFLNEIAKYDVGISVKKLLIKRDEIGYTKMIRLLKSSKVWAEAEVGAKRYKFLVEGDKND
jgi:hypothetical protein